MGRICRVSLIFGLGLGGGVRGTTNFLLLYEHDTLLAFTLAFLRIFKHTEDDLLQVRLLIGRATHEEGVPVNLALFISNVAHADHLHVLLRVGGQHSYELPSALTCLILSLKKVPKGLVL